MKKFLQAAIAAVALAAAPLAANAADWTPPGPIKLMIAFAAGGGADTQARLIAEELEARNGWKVIPEQVTGKGGVNAFKAVQEEPADGTAIAMIVSESVAYNAQSAKAGVVSDITPITTTAGSQMGIVALTSKGYATFGDVLEAAKGGEEIRFGTMSPRLSDMAYVIGKTNGVDFNIVQVRGGKAVMDGLNAGDMDVGFGAGIQTKAVMAGDMVNLASALSAPLDISPEAPLLSEYGVDFVAEVYFMLVGPADMDPAAREAIAAAVGEIVRDENTKAGELIKRAFGGATTIAGDELEGLLNASWDAASALMSAAAE